MEEGFVIEALFSGNRESQIQAAKILSSMKSKQRQKLVERGAIAPLVSMLQSQDYEAIYIALYALLSLSFGSERNKVHVAKSGVLPLLLNLLRYQSVELVELATTALLILSSCRENRQSMATSGAIQLLVEMLNEDYNSSTQSKVDAISTLHNLSTLPCTIPTLVSSALISCVFRRVNLSEKSSEIVEKAMAFLEKLVSLSNIALIQAAEADCTISGLVQTIEEGSSQSKEHALGILLLICQSNRDRYRGMILREGVVPGLLQLSVDGTWRARGMAGELLLILRNGPSQGGTGKPVKKNKLVEKIMEEIDAGGDNGGGKALRLVEKMIAKLSA